MRALAALLIVCSAAAQTPPRMPSPPPEPASVEGTVFGIRNGRPLNRAEVILSGTGNGAPRLGLFTDTNGQFSFRDLPPGRYLLAVRREGYLPNAFLTVGGVRRPVSFVLGRGQRFSNIVLKLHEAGLIAGRVRFEDAEPAPGVIVQFYRDRYDGRRHSYDPVVRAVTNDRGEFRATGLAPGSYYAAAFYTSPLAGTGIIEQPIVNSAGEPQPREEYITTFYPSAHRLSDAVPISIAFGQEVAGADLVLSRARVYQISGTAIDGVTGERYKAPKLALFRPDSTHSAAIPVAFSLSNPPEGGFVLQGLTAGTYLLTAEASHNGQRLRARQLITLTSGPVVNLELVLQPDHLVSGILRVQGDPQLEPGGLTVIFESRTQSEDTRRVDAKKDGTFTVPLSPEDTYDVSVSPLPAGTYLHSAQVAGSDILSYGLRGASTPVEITVHTGAARVNGVVRDNSQPVSGAHVRIYSSSPTGPAAWSVMGITDQDGNYAIGGLAPGNYIALAWLDTPPCNPDNPNELDECRRAGTELILQEGQLQKQDLPLR